MFEMFHGWTVSTSWASALDVKHTAVQLILQGKY
jgi:hypothetical protein